LIPKLKFHIYKRNTFQLLVAMRLSAFAAIALLASSALARTTVRARTNSSMTTSVGIEEQVMAEIADYAKSRRKAQRAAKSVPGKLRTVDVEDCTGCMFVWKNVENEVGDARMTEDITKSFTKICGHASKTAIFYPVCQDMKDTLWSMTGDYMDNMGPQEICTKAKVCRRPSALSGQITGTNTV